MPLRIHPQLAEPAAAPSADFLRRLPATPRRVAPAVAARWAAWLDALGAPAPVRRGLERLRDGAAAILTGQQAGVLGGPLLTLLKAARAISLAREIEAATGRPI